MIRALLIALALAGRAGAATYWVHPGGTCSDDNAGTSSSAPWCTPPGTRNAADTAFLSSGTWGSISSGNKIACGDTIWLYGGDTQTSSTGGRWWLSSTYYRDCTTGSRTTFRVSTNADWAGSGGDFTINGSGVTLNASSDVDQTGQNQCFNDHIALVKACLADYIEILGTATGKFRIINSAEYGFVYTGLNGGSPATTGLRGDYWELTGGQFGLNIGYVQQVRITNSSAHDNTRACWVTGLNNGYDSDSVGFENIEVYNCGSTTNALADDAFILDDSSEGIWCINCTAHDNRQRGIDGGTLSRPSTLDTFVTYRNLLSYNNGLACNVGGGLTCTGLHQPMYCCTGNTGTPCGAAPVNCTGASTPTVCGAPFDGTCDNGQGVCSCHEDCAAKCSGSGAEWSGDGDSTNQTAHHIVEGGIVYHNFGGGWGVYGGGKLDLWHAVAYANDVDNHGLGDVIYDQNGLQARYMNSIIQDNGRFNMNFRWRNSNTAYDIKPYSDYNIFFPASADSDTFADFWFNGSTFTTANRTFTQGVGFTNSNDKVGRGASDANDPKFVAIGAGCLTGTCHSSCSNAGATCDHPNDCTSCSGAVDYCEGISWSNCDFHTQAGSAARDTGTCPFVTGDAGSGTCVGTGCTTPTAAWTANTLLNDPRRYFRSPASYLDAPGDQIRIGDDLVTVTATSATKIDFTPSIAWSNGDCITWVDYSGSAPDRGYYEATTASAVTAAGRTGARPVPVRPGLRVPPNTLPPQPGRVRPRRIRWLQ